MTNPCTYKIHGVRRNPPPFESATWQEVIVKRAVNTNCFYRARWRVDRTATFIQIQDCVLQGITAIMWNQFGSAAVWWATEEAV